MAVPLDPRQLIHVARQPILDAARRVHGYELLYRARGTDQSCSDTGDAAAARVVTDALLAIGLDTLAGGAPAFLNFTRQLLLDQTAALLPARSVVIELREDIVVDDEVVEACRELKAKGYTLALDDFVGGSGAEALLPYVAFVKLDVLSTEPSVWEPLAARLASPSLRVVAERVETFEMMERAREAGCTLFQGYYFCRPATRTAKAMPARRLAYLNLFAAVNDPELTIAELENLVKRDVSLTMRVLKSVNSAAFAIRQPITSVRHALVMLGLNQVRKWASIWAMAGLNSGGTPEVVSVALLRARSCEIVGAEWSDAETGAELFLLGMCSMLDAILDQPLETAVAELQLTDRVRDALLGASNPMRAILDAVVAHEQGDWDRAAQLLEGLGLAPALLPAAYADALRWMRDISTSMAAA